MFICWLTLVYLYNMFPLSELGALRLSISLPIGQPLASRRLSHPLRNLVAYALFKRLLDLLAFNRCLAFLSIALALLFFGSLTRNVTDSSSKCQNSADVPSRRRARFCGQNLGYTSCSNLALCSRSARGRFGWTRSLKALLRTVG